MNNTLKHWPLLGFIKKHGMLYIGNFVNKETGEEFKGLVFTEPEGKQTFAERVK